MLKLLFAFAMDQAAGVVNSIISLANNSYLSSPTPEEAAIVIETLNLRL